MIQEQGAYLSPKMLERIEHYNRLVAEGYSHIRISPWGTLVFEEIYVMPKLDTVPEAGPDTETDVTGLSDMISNLVRILRQKKIITSNLDNRCISSNLGSRYPFFDLYLMECFSGMTSYAFSYPYKQHTHIISDYSDTIAKIAKLAELTGYPTGNTYAHSTSEQIRNLIFYIIQYKSLSSDERKELCAYVHHAETIDEIYRIIRRQNSTPDDCFSAIAPPFQKLCNELVTGVSLVTQSICSESTTKRPKDVRIHTIVPIEHKFVVWPLDKADKLSIFSILRELIDPLNESENESSPRLVLWMTPKEILSREKTIRPVENILQTCLRQNSLCGARELSDDVFFKYLNQGECLILIQMDDSCFHLRGQLHSALNNSFPGNSIICIGPWQSIDDHSSIPLKDNSQSHDTDIPLWLNYPPYFAKAVRRILTPSSSQAAHNAYLPLMSEIQKKSTDIRKKILHTSTEDDRRDPVSNLFADDDIIYVVGGAGYGKSLFLRRICISPQMLKGFDEEPLLVIRGDIKHLVRDDGTRQTMMDFLLNCFQEQSLHRDEEFSEGFLTACLEKGRCLVLLDALDEVGNEHREEIHSLIISFFTETHPGNKVCITSRDRGFIPRKNITCFYIQPIDECDVINYADRFISLNRFPKEYKAGFITEAMRLVEKQFVKGFLTLSLLLTIYREEGKLPDNKLQLYQKCFEYMANAREKDKDLIKNTKTGKIYDWNILDRFLSDESFMLLADRAVPNNRDISDRIIKKLLTDCYGGHFPSPLACKNAVDEFLQFCGDRTEIFVPSINSNTHYRFFHRSFFEYFYAQHISTAAADVRQICTMLESFDVDSEIYELLVMSYRANDCEDTVKALTEHLFHSAVLRGSDSDSSVQTKSFEMLVMLLQVLDEPERRTRFAELLYSAARELDGQILRTPFRMICDAVDSDHLHDLIRGSLDSLRDKMMQSLLQRYLQNRSVYNQYLLSLKEHTGQAVSLEDLEMQKQFFFPMLLMTCSDHCEQYDRMFQRAASRSYLLGPMGLKRKDADHVQSFLKDVSELPPQDRNSICYKLMLEELT